MNLLYYCDEYPPYKNGGIGSAVKLVAEALAARGHNVWVVGKYWDNTSATCTECINGVHVVRLHKDSYRTPLIKLSTLIHTKKGRRCKAQLIFNQTMQLVRDLIRKHHIELVEFPDYMDDFFFNSGLKMCQIHFPVPMVIRVHGSVSFLSYSKDGYHNQSKLSQDKAFFACTPNICAVSKYSKKYVEEQIDSDKAVEVIYNPIEDRLFEGVKDEMESDAILFFGKIIETKGAYNLIKAFNIIAAENADVRLKLIGNGDIAAAQALLADYCRDRVEFCGFKPKEDVLREIDNAMFCVLPSYFENFSMAALEVLSRKRALIYTKLASGPELISDGLNGILVEPTDVEELVRSMRLMINDKGQRTRMATQGYEMCRSRFSTNIVIPQMEQYYSSLISQ